MSKKDRKQPADDARSKVIHVVFGPGGGRIEPLETAPSSSRSATSLLADDALPIPSSREPVSNLFTMTEVAKLLGLSTDRLRTLDKNGVVAPTGKRRGKRAYTFQDIIALRAARDLLAKKVRLRDVVRAIESIRKALPRVTRPLAELSIVSDGQSVVLRSQTGSYEPVSGQMVIDFEVKSLRDDVVRVLRPTAGRARAKTAYDLYVRASQFDEDPSMLGEAERLYRRAIELDPWLAIAYTNLGNICFRRNDELEAEKLYRKALLIDDHQPEAQYNLGYVMLERGEADEAIRFFRGAILSDQGFADAYFNLAMALEQTGKVDEARPCWRKYLDIEPTGTWAEESRANTCHPRNVESVRKTVLVVEDDESISMGLEINLAAEGYEVRTAADGQTGLEAARQGIDLVILDVMLPVLNGLEVVKTLRSEGNAVPVIMLSARGAETDKIMGLELGAEDYITKPFSLAELLARTKAVLRRDAIARGGTIQTLFRAGDLEIDTKTRQIKRRGELVELTATEFDVLIILFRGQGRVLTRDEIQTEVWGPGHYGTRRTVDNFLLQLRTKLEDDPIHPIHLKTVRGVGYRFVVGDSPPSSNNPRSGGGPVSER